MAAPGPSRHGLLRRFSVLALVCVLTGAAGCREETGVKITGFDLQGVESIDKGRLKSVLATEESSKLPWGRKRYFDRAEFQADIQRIEAFYADRGFPDAHVASYDIDLNDDQTHVDLTIVVDEGEPIIAERIVLRGFDALPDDHRAALEERLSQKAGAPLDNELVTLSRAVALDEIRDHGYPHASVRVTETAGTGARDRVLTFTAEPGTLAHYGPVDVRVVAAGGGEGTVDDQVVLNQLTFEPGDTYRLGQVQESTRRLYGLELFQFVSIEEVDPDPASDEVKMRVTVTEGKHQRLRGAVGYGSEEQARVTGNYRHVNFLGGARTAGGEAKWSSLDRGISLNFGEPNLFRRTALNTKAEYWHFDQPLYQLTSAGGRATLTRRFGQSGALSGDRSVTTLSVGYLGEREDYTVTQAALDDPTFHSTLIALGLDPRTGRGQGLLSAITFDINRNTTENLLDARRGYVVSAHIEQAGLGGAYNYRETSLEGRHYWNLNERAVLASRVRVSALGGTDTPESDIPFFKRYFLGGSQSLRGWGRFEVSPLTEGGSPIGGFSALESTVELRMPVTENIGGVLFVDGGNVWRGTYDFDLGDMQYDAGAGVRYRTPVGPLRFDFAWQLKPIPRLVIDGTPPGEQRRWRLHFSVGQAF